MIIKEKMNPNKTARVAGFLYLLMAPFGYCERSNGPDNQYIHGSSFIQVAQTS